MNEGLERYLLTLVVIALVTVLGWHWVQQLLSLFHNLPVR